MWAGLAKAALGFLKALIVPVMAWFGGRKSAQADNAEDSLDRIDKANRARDRVNLDPDYRDELRRKYRERG